MKNQLNLHQVGINDSSKVEPQNDAVSDEKSYIIMEEKILNQDINPAKTVNPKLAKNPTQSATDSNGKIIGAIFLCVGLLACVLGILLNLFLLFFGVPAAVYGAFKLANRKHAGIATAWLLFLPVPFCAARFVGGASMLSIFNPTLYLHSSLRYMIFPIFCWIYLLTLLFFTSKLLTNKSAKLLLCGWTLCSLYVVDFIVFLPYAFEYDYEILPNTVTTAIFLAVMLVATAKNSTQKVMMNTSINKPHQIRKPHSIYGCSFSIP